MANMLDEMNDPVVNGRDVNVINKTVPVEKSTGALVLEIFLWIFGIIGGVIFEIIKAKRRSYFHALEQKLQHDASQIDNFMEQRAMILQNCARLLDKAIDLDKDVMIQVAKYRSGISDAERNEAITNIEHIGRSINVALEKYPDLKAHKEIESAMQQNSYLQREITAAREVYNDTINTWNREIFAWPINQMVCAKAGYTTRIPFATTSEIKEQARGVFF